MDFTVNISSVVMDNDEFEIVETNSSGNTSSISCSSNDSLSFSLLFHLASGVFLVSYLLPSCHWGHVSFHTGLCAGHIVMGIWAWGLTCAPDIFFWHCGFSIINIIQVIIIRYLVREHKFEPDLERLYMDLFSPMKISRPEFSHLISSSVACMLTLHPGECYAVAGLTKTDHLGILINGRCSVLNEQGFLHQIEESEFLDAPEFESMATASSEPETFQVTICAAIASKYIVWQRSTLEYLFVKEPRLGMVVSALISRDVTHKLYSMNKKVMNKSGAVLDIRLPPFASRMMLVNGEVTDLKRTRKRDQEYDHYQTYSHSQKYAHNSSCTKHFIESNLYATVTEQAVHTESEHEDDYLEGNVNY